MPANHYRLLGLEIYESDENVIEAAADKQMSFIRTFQGGRHSQQSQQLLNEISVARICLLNPEKKALYDAQLRSQERVSQTPPAAPPVAPPMPPVVPPIVPPLPPVPPQAPPFSERSGINLPMGEVPVMPLPPQAPPISERSGINLAMGEVPVPPAMSMGTTPPPPVARNSRSEGHGSGKSSDKNKVSDSDSNKEIPNFDFLNAPPNPFSETRYQTQQPTVGTGSTTSAEILLTDNLPPIPDESTAESSQNSPSMITKNRKRGRKRWALLKFIAVLLIVVGLCVGGCYLVDWLVPNTFEPIKSFAAKYVKPVVPAKFWPWKNE